MADTRNTYDGDRAAPIISFASSSLLVVALQIGALMFIAEGSQVSAVMTVLFLVTLAVYVIAVYLIYSNGARRGSLAAMGRAAVICGAAILLNFGVLASIYTRAPKKVIPAMAQTPVTMQASGQAFTCTTVYKANENGENTAEMICLPYTPPEG